MFSRNWTAEERLLLVIVLTDMIRDDVNAGRYSALGRPNIQSVHEMILATPEQLEHSRESIDDLLVTWSAGDAERVAELFSTPLSEHWGLTTPDRSR